MVELLPHEVGEIVSKVAKVIPGKNLGIHAHNDTENAVANSLNCNTCWGKTSTRNH